MATPFDYYTTRQVYLEGYKDGEVAERDKLFEEIAAVIAVLLTKLGYDNLGQLTKRQLSGFIAQVNQEVRRIFNREARLTMANIKRFMSADIDMLGKVLRLTDTESPDVRKERMWTEVNNAPIAGVGVEPAAIMAVSLSNIITDVNRAIKSAYADRKSARELLAALVGTKANKFKDGVLNKTRRQFRTAIQTTIQHVSAYLTFKMASLVADSYTWVAILDSRTTDICRGRNGKTYSFKDGPRPPAHWGCRSFIIPVTVVAVEDIPSFYTWIKRQPTQVQNEALGVDRGRKLRRGEIKADDLPGFDYTRPLTVDQYRDKLTKVLDEVA
jgi:SPP1 gp7 family putative phage head morphogenesis protein